MSGVRAGVSKRHGGAWGAGSGHSLPGGEVHGTLPILEDHPHPPFLQGQTGTRARGQAGKGRQVHAEAQCTADEGGRNTRGGFLPSGEGLAERAAAC